MFSGSCFGRRESRPTFHGRERRRRAMRGCRRRASRPGPRCGAVRADAQPRPSFGLFEARTGAIALAPSHRRRAARAAGVAYVSGAGGRAMGVRVQARSAPFACAGQAGQAGNSVNFPNVILMPCCSSCRRATSSSKRFPDRRAATIIASKIGGSSVVNWSRFFMSRASYLFRVRSE